MALAASQPVPEMNSPADHDLFIPTERESFLSLLWGDVLASNVHFGTVTGVHARQFFRSMFALIEGAVWIFKQEALDQHKRGFAVFSTSELCVLSEISPVVDARGNVSDQPATGRFVPNLLFTFRCHASAFDYDPVLHIGDHEWAELKMSVKVRNRLMHPKQLSSMEVSDDELQTARGALRWFGLRCSAAMVGASMWHAKQSLKTIDDPTDATARLHRLSAAADNFKRIILES